VTVIRPAAVLGERAASRVASRAIAVLLALTVAVDAAFLIGLVISNGDNNPIVNIGLSLATQWIPVTAFWLVASRGGFRNVSVVLAAAAVTFSAIGDTYWALAMDSDGYLPYPSPADAGYLLFYPLMVIALLTLVRRALSGIGRLVLLETAVATVGASAVLAVVLDPVISAALADDSVLGSAVAVSYPLFDLILLAVIAGISTVPTVSLDRHWWALIAGLAIFAAADVAYALLESEGAYTSGTPLDATWAIGLGLMTWWVVGAARPIAKPVLARRSGAVPLPAVAVLAGLAVLVVGTQVPLSMLAIVLAALTVGLGAVPIVFRQAMLGRMLAAQEEAVRRLTELDRAKTDILTTVNHEFRTPLTSITGHVELLLDGAAGDLPPAATGMLEAIERNGSRLQALIDETFTASRFDEAGDDDAWSTLDVGGITACALRQVTAAAERRGVRLDLDPAEPDLRVDGDVAQLELAFAKLLDNAVKFTPPAGHVEVSAGRHPDDGDIVVRITDDGMGIPADDIPRLFSRFFRASNVQNAAIPGVGLGLATAKQIVAAHGGSIAVESELGSGTTMTIRLPAARESGS
jgi:signal transduction histidine kinase